MKEALLTLLLITCLFAAEDFTVTAEVDKNIAALDEQIVLQVRVSGPGTPALNIPKINDFTVYNGGQSKQSSMAFVNGAYSSSTTIIYTYGLSPKGIGKFTIPSFSVEVKGKIYKTDSIEIEVTKGGQSAAPGISASSDKNLFVQMTADKQRVYVNEPVTLTFGLYTRVNLTGQVQYSPPETTGFWKEDLPPQRNYNSNGYAITELKTALFPSQPGEFSIGKASIACTVPTRGRDDDFFGGFFGGGKNVRLESKAVAITVLPLPAEGRPVDFSGTVGRYSLSVTVDKVSVKTGDAVNLAITIAGTGNIKSITEPKLLLSDAFKQYETVSDINTSKERYEVKGSKVFKTVLVPRKAGKLTIPGVNYSIFDPVEKKYKQLVSAPIILNVAQGLKEEYSSLANMPNLPAAEGVNVFGSDIRHIKQTAKFTFAKDPYYRSALYIVLILLPFIIWLSIILVRKFESSRLGNIAHFKASKAYSTSLKKYKTACSLINKGNCENCYAELENILVEYIGDKINRPAAGLSVEEIKKIISSRIKEPELPNAAAALLEELHFMRFAPASKSELEPVRLASRIKEIIIKLEKAGL